MKVLAVYGGVNKGLKKGVVPGPQRGFNDLTLNNQFYLKSISSFVNNSKEAAKEGIEVIQRHYQDLRDYLFD